MVLSSNSKASVGHQIRSVASRNSPITISFKVYGIVTHGVLSGPALDRINESSLEKFIVTNTIPQRENMTKVYLGFEWRFRFQSTEYWA